MQISVSITELNARIDGIATVNGINVIITDSPLSGSEKQVAWAEDIRRKSVLMLADKALNMLTTSDSLLSVDGSELDAAVERINSEICPAIAAKIDGITDARTWIDNRGLDAAYVAQIAK